MPNKKISELATAGPLIGTEYIPIVQDGQTKKFVASDLILTGDEITAKIPPGTYAEQRTSFRPPTVVAGRQWTTNFSAAMAAQDDAIWTLTNLTRVVDGARPAAKMTSLAAFASCLTKEIVRDVDVLVRWRLADTEDVYNIGFAQMAVHARRVSKGNRISYDYDIWHNAQYPVALTNGDELELGVNQVGGFDPAAPFSATNTTDVTNDRFMRIRVIGGTVAVKHWLSNVPEPDWTYVRLARGGNSPAGDNIEAGNAGFEALYNGGFIYEVTVTELLPTAELAVDGRMSPVDSVTGLPLGWTPHGVIGGSTTVINTVSIPDPWGVTRKVFHVNKPAGTGYDGGQLRIYNTRRRGLVYSTRRSPDPFATFPSLVRVSVWSKANNVINASPSAVNLGSAAVLYYYDKVPVARNLADSQYYRALGPTVVPNPPLGDTASGPGGIGTWDWFETTWIMPIHATDDIYWVDVFIGLHDPGATGELWVSDVSIIPVIL